MCFGTGFQPALFAAISYPETSSPVTESAGFQPEPLLIAIAIVIAIVFRKVVFVLSVLFFLKPSET